MCRPCAPAGCCVSAEQLCLIGRLRGFQPGGGFVDRFWRLRSSSACFCRFDRLRAGRPRHRFFACFGVLLRPASASRLRLLLRRASPGVRRLELGVLAARSRPASRPASRFARRLPARRSSCLARLRGLRRLGGLRGRRPRRLRRLRGRLRGAASARSARARPAGDGVNARIVRRPRRRSCRRPSGPGGDGTGDRRGGSGVTSDA